MGNLENILNEKNDAIDKVTSKIASALVKEEKKYQSRVKSIEKRKHAQLNELNQDYCPKVTEALISDLTNDSQVMVERSNYTALPQEKLDEVLKIKKSIEDLKSRAKSKKEFERPLNVLLSYLPQETKDLINAPDIEKAKDKSQITTYVTSNGDSCYILCPITDKPSDKLSNDIQDRLLGVITRGKVIKGGDYLYFRGNAPDYANGFLFFKIEPDSSQPEILAKELISKLNDEHIQPESFKKAGITHLVKPLDYNIFKNFLNYCTPEQNQNQPQSQIVGQVNEVYLQSGKKKGRPFGSKNKVKGIESTVTDTRDIPLMESLEDIGGDKNQEDDSIYLGIKSRYDALTEKYGHNPTRSELGWNHRDFYKELKDAEAKYGKFDFIPKLKSGRKNKDKKKE